MSIPAITAASFINRDGDSINDRSLPYQSMNGLMFAIDSFFLQRPSNGSFRRPGSVNYATAGATTATMEARKTAILANATTHYFGQGGINDVQTGMPLADSVANVTSILTYCQAQGVLGGLWIGPLCLGELQPSGANVDDAAIDLWDSTIATLINAFPGWAYVSARTKIYGVQEPILNAPPPGVASGILCFPAGGLGGIHPNPTGNSFFVGNTLPLLTLA